MYVDQVCPLTSLHCPVEYVPDSPKYSQVFICGRPLAGDFALRSHQSLISIRGNVFSLKDAAGQGKAFFRSHVIRTNHINM